MELQNDVLKQRSPKKAAFLQGFFKTGKGQYAEGDIFYGLTVGQSRALSRKYKDLSFTDLQILMNSEIHEERLIALLILVLQYESTDDSKVHTRIYKFFLKNSKRVNNWDLVDSSAPNIVGNYLLHRDRAILYKYAASTNLWQRRIAIISTFTFIRNNDFKDTLKIVKLLMNDKHDLIHKACGWMLREVGKRDVAVLKKFLNTNTTKLPRTALRYSIEHFPKSVRDSYLKLK